ncbi:peptidoglycan-binding protein [Falsiroseomonas sp. E2-1-a4]|uniref:peptidoglycan-binding protein n=1 Tax=Falsiroseomonas sp. E2-1-a4 TaxID=3239299 RepID=UPI003F2D8EC0
MKTALSSVARLGTRILALGFVAAFPVPAEAQLDHVLRDLMGRLTAPQPVQPPYAPPQYAPPPTYRPPPERALQAPPPARAPQSSQPRQADGSALDRREVAEAQRHLNELGYDAGPADGAPGPRTIAALSAFQRDYGQRQTRALTSSVMAEIREAWQERSGAAAPARRIPPVAAADCNRVSTPVERTICANPALTEKDRELGQTYAAARDGFQPEDRIQLQQDQRSWLRARDGCGPDARCLEAVMQARIEALRNLLPTRSESAASAPLRATEAPQWAAVPSMTNVPIVDLAGPAHAFLPSIGELWNEERARGSQRPAGAHVVAPSRTAWARTIRALGLVAVPRPLESLDDLEVRSLACLLLDPPARATVFGRTPAYGPYQDVCGTWHEGEDPARGPTLSASARIALREGAAAFRARELPRILAETPQLPLRMLVRWPVSAVWRPAAVPARTPATSIPPSGRD